MPQEDKNPKAQDQSQPPKTEFITREEFMSGLDRIASTMKDGFEALREYRQNPQPYAEARPDPEPDLPDPTDEDDVPTVARKVVAKELRPVIQAIKNFETIGLGTMGKLAERQVVEKLPHYKRYKKEIDGVLGTMAPALRAQPDAIEMAYDLVVGRHAEELANERAEEKVREITKAATPQKPSRANSRDFEAEGLPTPQQLGLSESQVQAVENRGGWDAWARKMSGGRYKSYADYAKAYLRMQGKDEKQEEAD